MRNTIMGLFHPQEGRHHWILENSPDGKMVVNREGRITYANPSAEEIFGLVRSSLTSRNYNDKRWKIPFPTRSCHSR